MYPKIQRVKKQKQIDTLSRSRYSVKTPVLQLKAFQQDRFQIMLIVGKKVFKKAHDRVKSKRRLIGAFRDLGLDKSLPPAAYQIRLYNSAIKDYNYGELKAEMLDGFSKLSKVLTQLAK